MSVVRVDENYLKLSDALLKLGCALYEMYQDQVEDIKVVLPAKMHRDLFGECKGFQNVVVQGPYGQYRVESAK